MMPSGMAESGAGGASAAGLPLVAVAFCRGIQVGQATLVTNVGANPVSIPLVDDADGVRDVRRARRRTAAARDPARESQWFR